MNLLIVVVALLWVSQRQSIACEDGVSKAFPSSPSIVEKFDSYSCKKLSKGSECESCKYMLLDKTSLQEIYENSDSLNKKLETAGVSYFKKHGEYLSGVENIDAFFSSIGINFTENDIQACDNQFLKQTCPDGSDRFEKRMWNFVKVDNIKNETDKDIQKFASSKLKEITNSYIKCPSKGLIAAAKRELYLFQSEEKAEELLKKIKEKYSSIDNFKRIDITEIEKHDPVVGILNDAVRNCPEQGKELGSTVVDCKDYFEKIKKQIMSIDQDKSFKSSKDKLKNLWRRDGADGGNFVKKLFSEGMNNKCIKINDSYKTIGCDERPIKFETSDSDSGCLDMLCNSSEKPKNTKSDYIDFCEQITTQHHLDLSQEAVATFEVTKSGLDYVTAMNAKFLKNDSESITTGSAFLFGGTNSKEANATVDLNKFCKSSPKDPFTKELNFTGLAEEWNKNNCDKNKTIEFCADKDVEALVFLYKTSNDHKENQRQRKNDGVDTVGRSKNNEDADSNSFDPLGKKSGLVGMMLGEKPVDKNAITAGQKMSEGKAPPEKENSTSKGEAASLEKSGETGPGATSSSPVKSTNKNGGKDFNGKTQKQYRSSAVSLPNVPEASNPFNSVFDSGNNSVKNTVSKELDNAISNLRDEISDLKNSDDSNSTGNVQRGSGKKNQRGSTQSFSFATSPSYEKNGNSKQPQQTTAAYPGNSGIGSGQNYAPVSSSPRSTGGGVGAGGASSSVGSTGVGGGGGAGGGILNAGNDGAVATGKDVSKKRSKDDVESLPSDYIVSTASNGAKAAKPILGIPNDPKLVEDLINGLNNNELIEVDVTAIGNSISGRQEGEAQGRMKKGTSRGGTVLDWSSVDLLAEIKKIDPQYDLKNINYRDKKVILKRELPDGIMLIILLPELKGNKLVYTPQFTQKNYSYFEGIDNNPYCLDPLKRFK